MSASERSRLSWTAFTAVMVPFLIVFGLFLRALRGL